MLKCNKNYIKQDILYIYNQINVKNNNKYKREKNKTRTCKKYPIRKKMYSNNIVYSQNNTLVLFSTIFYNIIIMININYAFIVQL